MKKKFKEIPFNAEEFIKSVQEHADLLEKQSKCKHCLHCDHKNHVKGKLICCRCNKEKKV